MAPDSMRSLRAAQPAPTFAPARSPRQAAAINTHVAATELLDAQEGSARFLNHIHDAQNPPMSE